MSVTRYKGLSKIYFDSLLKKIINIGGLANENISILDFGCGEGRLKEMIGKSVTNFDKRSDLTEIPDWKDCQFNYFVANHVFYELSEEELHSVCREIKQRMLNQNITLIIGIARQGMLSRMGKLVLNRRNAHQDTKISPSQQIKILKQYFNIKRSINFWFLTQILITSDG
jgi:hypothetical protein|tara:strand:+ start:418 stop:927 length:510 start_codon:yes stop_codon:yes gene_type:complete